MARVEALPLPLPACAGGTRLSDSWIARSLSKDGEVKLSKDLSFTILYGKRLEMLPYLCDFGKERGGVCGALTVSLKSMTCYTSFRIKMGSMRTFGGPRLLGMSEYLHCEPVDWEVQVPQGKLPSHFLLDLAQF